MLELDLNLKNFQQDLFSLQKDDLSKVIGTLRKLSQLTWEQLYRDGGLNWEWVASKKVYTLRASQKICITALREGNVLKLLAIFPDHDSAYE
jgi:hypothetical protein